MGKGFYANYERDFDVPGFECCLLSQGMKLGTDLLSINYCFVWGKVFKSPFMPATLDEER